MDIEPARQEVNIFRGLYQTGKYSDIYKITSSDFQTATSEKIYRHNERSKRKRSWDL